MKKDILLFSIMTMIIITGCAKNTSDVVDRNYPHQTKELCEAGGATWKMFNTGCHDECYNIRSTDPVKCTLAFSEGCDCGPDKCWDGQTCVLN